MKWAISRGIGTEIHSSKLVEAEDAVIANQQAYPDFQVVSVIENSRINNIILHDNSQFGWVYIQQVR